MSLQERDIVRGDFHRLCHGRISRGTTNNRLSSVRSKADEHCLLPPPSGSWVSSRPAGQMSSWHARFLCSFVFLNVSGIWKFWRSWQSMAAIHFFHPNISSKPQLSSPHNQPALPNYRGPTQIVHFKTSSSAHIRTETSHYVRAFKTVISSESVSPKD